MLRRVVEARTKKRGRFSFSDSALRHSRRRWSRACCSGVRSSGPKNEGKDERKNVGKKEKKEYESEREVTMGKKEEM